MKSLHSLLLIFFLLVASCSAPDLSNNWRFSDDVYAAVDETFQPIVEEVLDAFRKQHVEADDHVLYINEDSAFRLLLMDSVRCIVATRKVTDEERKIIAASPDHLGVEQALVATDALALITNAANTDTLISVDDLRDIVSGKITRWEQLRHATRKGELSLVFDASGSSTVRYMRDSLNNGRELKGNLYAQGSNDSVIAIVKRNPDVIGVIGANWLKQPGQPVITDFSQLDIHVLKVTSETDENPIGFRPYQYRIATGEYPLIRSVYVISTDPRKDSNVRLFYFYLKGQKGQTIICNSSQLLPYSPVQVKPISVR